MGLPLLHESGACRLHHVVCRQLQVWESTRTDNLILQRCRQAIEQRGVRVEVNKLGHHVPAECPAPGKVRTVTVYPAGRHALCLKPSEDREINFVPNCVRPINQACYTLLHAAARCVPSNTLSKVGGLICGSQAQTRQAARCCERSSCTRGPVAGEGGRMAAKVKERFTR